MDSIVQRLEHWPFVREKPENKFIFCCLSDEGPTLETLDFTIHIGNTPTFYISICISTLPTQHTMFILLIKLLYFKVPVAMMRSLPDRRVFKRSDLNASLVCLCGTKHAKYNIY